MDKVLQKWKKRKWKKRIIPNKSLYSENQSVNPLLELCQAGIHILTLPDFPHLKG